MKKSVKKMVTALAVTGVCLTSAAAVSWRGKSIDENVFYATTTVSVNARGVDGAKIKWKPGGKPKPMPSHPDKPENQESAQPTSLAAAILRQGASGSEVKEVQSRLKKWGYYTGAVDGVFGAGTRKAVIAFQKKNGLTADGVVGKSTYQALGMNSSYNVLVGQSGTQYSNSDLYLLAKTIHAEGRGEPYTGQVAIGAVIMNRLRSSQFPNTIAGVVYQKHAFTAVSDGQINLTPNETAMRAARDAMNGWDPTGGALYYYNPAVATSAWIFDRQTVTVIGKHVFAI